MVLIWSKVESDLSQEFTLDGKETKWKIKWKSSDKVCENGVYPSLTSGLSYQVSRLFAGKDGVHPPCLGKESSKGCCKTNTDYPHIDSELKEYMYCLILVTR